MGLLDDAIREHLELKRRGGADPDEVARMEREALSPVRRDRASAQESEDAADEAAVADELEEQEQGQGSAEAAPAGGAEDLWLDDDVAAPYSRESHAVDDETAEHRLEDEAEDHESTPFEDELEDRDEAARLGGEQPGADAPEHHEPESSRDDDEPGDDESDEDVLEETPDFLQDAPEHDRLWFEQKPPRDFDF